MKINYQARGTVLGYDWSGVLCCMESKSFSADNLDDLKKQIELALEFNQATGTGDLQSQIGAAMLIDTIREVEIEGRVFCNVSSESFSFGDMTEDQSAFVWDAHYFEI
jgi:hypothetical protein